MRCDWTFCTGSSTEVHMGMSRGPEVTAIEVLCPRHAVMRIQGCAPHEEFQHADRGPVWGPNFIGMLEDLDVVPRYTKTVVVYASQQDWLEVRTVSFPMNGEDFLAVVPAEIAMSGVTAHGEPPEPPAASGSGEDPEG
jgi:hypothetical protein